MYAASLALLTAKTCYERLFVIQFVVFEVQANLAPVSIL